MFSNLVKLFKLLILSPKKNKSALQGSGPIFVEKLGKKSEIRLNNCSFMWVSLACSLPSQITLPKVLCLVGYLYILTRLWEFQSLHKSLLCVSLIPLPPLLVFQDASSADIRKAYRRLSLILHPDKNKEENAETQFRQVSPPMFLFF